jgi:peptidoglycan/LPS O-acetylase OafA/YrhL
LTQAKQRFYRPELDVLRFAAFLLVFLHHAFPSTGPVSNAIQNACALGVCLFFLLSSYLITELMELEEQASGTIRLDAFYVRRVLRIWPLYIAMLLLDFVILRFTHPGVFTGLRLAAFLLLAGNWYVVLHGFIYTISTPLWSISIEEQFYVLWPSIRKYSSRKGSLALSTLTFVAAYFTLYILCKHNVDADTGVWANSFVQFQFFSTGALLALALRKRTPQLPSLVRIMLFTVGVALLFAAQYVFHVKTGMSPASFPMLASGYLCANAGCIIIFLSFLGAQQLGKAKVLVYLGKISYGLYVFHWLVLRIVDRLAGRVWPHEQGAFESLIKIVLGLALTIMISSLSYHFFEAPILRFKKRFEVVRTRPA